MSKKITAAADMTFRQAYEVLQHHAETLRNQSEPNIDDLLTLVQESVAAYKVCQKQIAAVEQALQKALTDMDEAMESASPASPDSKPAASGRKPVRSSRKSDAEALAPSEQTDPSDSFLDDDIPF